MERRKVKEAYFICLSRDVESLLCFLFLQKKSKILKKIFISVDQGFAYEMSPSI